MLLSDHIIFTNQEEFKGVLSKYIGETEKNLILSDTNTAAWCFPLILELFPHLNKENLITLDAGDDEKNITSLHHIWSVLLHHGADRNTRLLNLGGGMVTDIGGFAAATFKRGIRFVNIPTSLLGMVDASIGGKTGINLSIVKNQVGAFAKPEAVIIYPPFLETLPPEELLSGSAEMLKTALALDKKLYQKLSKIKLDQSSFHQIDEDLIRRTASLKSEVCKRDFHDKAERQCLNFGHSIGHALEALYFSYGKALKHGFAVAAGILCEAYISSAILKLSKAELLDIESYILKNFPPVFIDEKEFEALIQLIRHDKKNFHDDIRMSLINEIGNCKYGVEVTDENIRESLKFYMKITKE